MIYAQAIHVRTQVHASSETVTTNADVRRVTQGNDAKVWLFVYIIIALRSCCLDYKKVRYFMSKRNKNKTIVYIY